MIQIDMQMPSSCYDCWIRQNMGCRIANDSGWLNDRRDDNCPLKEQEAKIVQVIGYVSVSNVQFANCPWCSMRIHDDESKKYCGHCGQAVKW